MSGVDADKINLLSVRVLKSSIEIGENFVKSDTRSAALSIGYNSGVNIEAKRCLFNLKAIIDFESEEELDQAHADYIIQFLFEIDNMDEFANVDDQEIPVVSGELSATLLGIAYSTARGLILSSTEQSVMGGVLLPVVNPINLLLDGREENHRN